MTGDSVIGSKTAHAPMRESSSSLSSWVIFNGRTITIISTKDGLESM